MAAEEPIATDPGAYEELEAPEERLPLIPLLVSFLRWIEELIVALSGYGIVFALAVGVIDLLTDGQLTAQAPWVDYAYAISFAGAIAGQIIGLASRSSRSFSQGQGVRGVAYTLLVLLLAFTEYQASVIFGFHKAFGTPVVDSLQQLGINQSQFIQLRAGVGVFLAVLSGYLRYQPKRRKTIAQLQKEADYQRQVDAITAQNRAANVKNLAGLAGNLGQGVRAAVRNATAATTDEPAAAASVAMPPPPEAPANPQ
jgi:uncharacterized membrane protein YjfL (UPF0719 family)